jgi:site-specific recombinase XerD
MKTDALPSLLRAFFHNWMGHQRNLSPQTVTSYRDAWKLFLQFVSRHVDRPVAKLKLEDLTEVEVLAFLQYIESTRSVSIGTRNCRLAAIRSFFRFVAERDPTATSQCAAILRIPTKKASNREVCYLDEAEVAAILRQPNRSTPEGQRDHALFSLLYNTGARIQEVLDLRPLDIRFKTPAQVRLVGKGRKERICPIWDETAQLIAALLRRMPRKEDEQVFVNRYGQPLGAAGVRYKLDHYVNAAAESLPTLAKKQITPHTFRHTVGVTLVSAGVDVTVIRNWLGHVSLDTTNHYARANLETKRKTLEKFTEMGRRDKPPKWKRNADLLSWLDSL